MNATFKDNQLLRSMGIAVDASADDTLRPCNHSGMLSALRHFERLYFEETNKTRDLSVQLRAAHDREDRLERHKCRLVAWLTVALTVGVIGWALWAFGRFG